jgi:hypothetical protein
VSGFDCEIKLIKQEQPKDENGNPKKDSSGFVLSAADVSECVVFASIKSVGHSEFYNSLIAGTKALKKFDIWAHEYNGEGIIEYQGERFRVLRDYIVKNAEVIEITVTDMGVRNDDLL